MLDQDNAGPAVLRVRRPSGALATFDAERATIRDGLVTASGAWRDDRSRRRHTRSWPARRVIEIRWLAVAA